MTIVKTFAWSPMTPVRVDAAALDVPIVSAFTAKAPGGLVRLVRCRNSAAGQEGTACVQAVRVIST